MRAKPIFVDVFNAHTEHSILGALPRMGSIYRRMLARPLRLGWSLLPSVVRPSRIKRIIDILCYSRDQSSGGNELPAAELLSIAVAPEARGGGIAEILYRRLIAHFGQQGVGAFKITVGNALAPAHRFYTKMGAVPTCSAEVHRGESSTVYVHYLAPDRDANAQ